VSILHDLSQAFDCLEPTNLKSKLIKLGICGVPLDLIMSCLTDRKVCVEVTCKPLDQPTKRYRSRTATVSRGTPQGSIIGPFLFLLGMNDLPSRMQLELDNLFGAHVSDLVTLYADDVNHVVANKNMLMVTEICQATIDIFRRWTAEGKLVPNALKACFLQFHPPTAPVPEKIALSMGDVSIAESDVASFLGLRMTPTLKWANHVDYICNKLMKGIYILGSLRNSVSFDVLKLVYFAHIVSHLRNNIIFWGHCTEARRIFSLQKRAIRTMFKVGRLTQDGKPISCAPLFIHKDMKVLTLPSMYIMECSMFVIKNSGLFDRNSDRHNHDTRGSNDLSHIGHKKAILEKSPKYRIIHVFNKLPKDITANEKCPSLFKSKLKEFLMSKNFYDVNDFLKPNM
jgi:Reverse transcriptase (RNA-dependent DNA polymerase)